MGTPRAGAGPHATPHWHPTRSPSRWLTTFLRQALVHLQLLHGQVLFAPSLQVARQPCPKKTLHLVDGNHRPPHPRRALEWCVGGLTLGALLPPASLESLAASHILGWGLLIHALLQLPAGMQCKGSHADKQPCLGWPGLAWLGLLGSACCRHTCLDPAAGHFKVRLLQPPNPSPGHLFPGPARLLLPAASPGGPP